MTDPLFCELQKLPTDPAARILARNNVVLQTPLDAPASASVSDVLQELQGKDAQIDILQLLAHALPAREATWWACLAARCMLDGTPLTLSLKSAEAWVRQPSLGTRTIVREALDTASNEDETMFCAMAASFADGTLGPGELEDFDAPPGAVGGAVFGMVLTALFADDDAVEARGPMLLEYGLDIARGGNGQVATTHPTSASTATEFTS